MRYFYGGKILGMPMISEHFQVYLSLLMFNLTQNHGGIRLSEVEMNRYFPSRGSLRGSLSPLMWAGSGGALAIVRGSYLYVASMTING